MARRSPGDGGISYIKTKKIYMGRVDLGRDVDGKRKRVPIYAKTKTEVIQKMQDYRRTNYGLKLENPTFDDLFCKWLYQIKKSDLKPRSFQKYEGLYKNYISKSPFINEKIKSITPGNIKAWYSELENLDASLNTIQFIHERCVKSSFIFAVDEELLLRNPAKKVTLKAPQNEPKIKAWTKDEQLKFTAAILESDDELKYIYLFALATGLRLGEILCLNWTDLKNGHITVNKTVSYVKHADGTYKNIIASPKTKTSIRTVKVPETMIKLLETTKSDNPLIFPGDREDGFHDNKKPARRIHAWCKKLDISDITFHNLRTTYATRLFEAGVQLKIVQKLLGHSTLSMTEKIYIQVMPEVSSQAVNVLNDLF